MPINARTPDSVRMVHVIEVQALRGNGTVESPARIVTQYWSAEGILLAENDPHLQPQEPTTKVGDH